MSKNIFNRFQTLTTLKMPRWDSLPAFGIYRDQLLSIVNDAVAPVFDSEDPVITASMVNNYVKWEMMPKPEKKKYGREHIAFAIVITALKPVLSIAEIKEGVLLQCSINGIESAYEAFCEAFERIFSQRIYKNDSASVNIEGVNTDLNKLGIIAALNCLYFHILTGAIIRHGGVALHRKGIIKPDLSNLF